jgi:hypothetical protein
MISLRRRFSLLKAAMQVIRIKNAYIEELQRMSLVSQVAARDLVVAWRVSLDSPEIDLRGDLDLMIRDLDDNICQLQEHI